MILDIIAIVVILGLMAIGFYNGLVRTLSNTVGWAGAVILGFVVSPSIKSYFINHTDMLENFKNTLIDKGFAGDNPMTDGSAVPEIVRNTANTITGFITEKVAENLSLLFISIISFAIVVVFIKLLLFVAVHLFSRRNTDGFTGMMDAVLGCGIGILQGFFWICLVLAIAFPVIGLVAPDFSTTLMGWIDGSSFVKGLYNHNFLLIFVQSLF